MNSLSKIALFTLLSGAVFAAQAADPHAGHVMPQPAKPDPHAGHVMPDKPKADPHAGPDHDKAAVHH